MSWKEEEEQEEAPKSEPRRDKSSFCGGERWKEGVEGEKGNDAGRKGGRESVRVGALKEV